MISVGGGGGGGGGAHKHTHIHTHTYTHIHTTAHTYTTTHTHTHTNTQAHTYRHINKYRYCTLCVYINAYTATSTIAWRSNHDELVPCRNKEIWAKKQCDEMIGDEATNWYWRRRRNSKVKFVDRVANHPRGCSFNYSTRRKNAHALMLTLFYVHAYEHINSLADDNITLQPLQECMIGSW